MSIRDSQIAANAGQEGAVIVEEVRSKKGSYGFNAQTEEYGDLIKMGVIDPTKVVRTARGNAGKEPVVSSRFLHLAGRTPFTATPHCVRPDDAAR